MTRHKDKFSPRTPGRPLVWPEVVTDLREIVPDPAQVFLVGGSVRDALRGKRSASMQEFDLTTSGDALQLARHIGDALGGAYFPLDAERGVGRTILDRGDGRLTLDVAQFRGADLAEDLRDRDFTVNAMAVSLGEPNLLIDPLGGESDLLREKVLRLCAPHAVADDPIRALRAVRFGLHFGLRLAKETLAAVKRDGRQLVDQAGQLKQPERTRDELFKSLGHIGKTTPAGAARLLNQLGLLQLAFPTLVAEHIGLLEHLGYLLLTISPARDDNIAANLTYGLAVMTLDRHRAALQEHIGVSFGDGRPLTGLLALAALEQPGSADETSSRLMLSRAERERLATIEKSTRGFMSFSKRPSPRDIHRYYRGIGEAGIDGVLLGLASHLQERAQAITQDAKGWGILLDEIASPLLDGFFRQHQQVVKPPPLVTGDDLMDELGLEPGPQIGELLERLLEEQAAGEISRREEALKTARTWMNLE